MGKRYQRRGLGATLYPTFGTIPSHFSTVAHLYLKRKFIITSTIDALGVPTCVLILKMM